jgi:hypothetical protein
MHGAWSDSAIAWLGILPGFDQEGQQMDADFKNSMTGWRQTQKQQGCELARNAKLLARGSERDAMFACLQEIVLDGLRHGFFDCVITSEVVKDRKRRVVISAGKSHQFTIEEEDLHK